MQQKEEKKTYDDIHLPKKERKQFARWYRRFGYLKLSTLPKIILDKTTIYLSCVL